MSQGDATADAWGIVPAYEDAFGNWTEVPADVREQLVRAMGGDPQAAGGPPAVDDVHVLRPGEELPTTGPLEVHLEDGTARSIEGRLPEDVPYGYHELLAPGDAQPRRLIVSPGMCWLPDDLRAWGWATQLYALRSEDSWGIGDLADLRRLGAWSRQRGAGTVLVNPLDAVNPTSPRETSPYFPTTRRWRDPVYLRIEEVPGAADAPEVADLAAAARRWNDDRRIDRDAIYATKIAALELLWERTRDATGQPGFRRYRHHHGTALERFATFLTLAESFGTGWQGWPESYRHPDDAEVARFVTEHADRVAFHAWVQWLLDEQLGRAGEEIPILSDLPIGFDPDGADAWEWQDLIADGVTVGAPPDELGPEGQDWRLPAFVPWKLRRARYEPFIATLRAAFRHAGGLRIDHVLGLFRLFWIPPGGGPADGAYVRQPTRDLLGILALESQRARAWVVGEDLGTVEGAVRPTLSERQLLRYQVWWFEDEPPSSWSQDALASVSTHDLPTVAGTWTGRDADIQRAVGREPDPGWFERQRQRIMDRTGISHDADAHDASVAIHRVLARAPNRVVVAQLEDAIAETERPNVPGTTASQRANWSLALPVTLEELEQHPTANAVSEAMDRARA